MPVRGLSLFFEAIGDFARSWPRLLATDVIYKVVAFVVLTPLVGLALRIFMSASGASVLADEEILFFILSPLGITALVVVAGVGLAIVALEQACLMTLGVGEARSRHVLAVDALGYGARHAVPVISMTLRIVWRSLILAAPFLAAAGGAYLLFLRQYDINYYLTERPPSFLFAAGLIIALLAVMAVLVVRRLLGWSFALPLVLFEGLQPARALSVSEERAVAHRWMVALTLVIWAIAALLLSLLPVVFLETLGRWLVPRFADSLNWMVVVMGSVLLVWALLGLLVSMISASMFALLVVRLYLRFGAAPEADLMDVVARERAAAKRVERLSGRLVAIVAAVLLLMAAGAGYLLLDSVVAEDDVLVIAHRGAAGRAPENTLAAVELALEDGADVVEIDVQENADGEVVVIHDSDLMKVAGVDLKIWDATAEQLRTIDVGKWFASEFAGQRVPLLEEVLAACKGKATVDIELKFYGHDERLEERVAEVVERIGMSDQVILMSLNNDQVQKMKALRPDWTVGLLTATAVGDLTSMEADFLAVNAGIATPGFVRRAHRAGKEVYVWTVNDQLNMSRYMSRGVDGVITDEPALARRVLERRGEMSFAERLLISTAFWIGLDPKEPAPEEDL